MTVHIEERKVIKDKRVEVCDVKPRRGAGRKLFLRSRVRRQESGIRKEKLSSSRDGIDDYK